MKRRRNPSHAGQFVFTVVATVASSLITLAIVALLERRKAAAASAVLPQPIAPGHGSA